MEKGLDFRKERYFQALIVSVLLCLSTLVSSSPRPSEYDVKLAYLYNFTKFMNWPEQLFEHKNSPYVLCIVGNIQIKPDVVKQLQQKTSRNRPIQIRFINEHSSIDKCHVLFITRTINYRSTMQLAQNANGTGTVLVGEVPGFAQDHGIVEFILDDRNRVRIIINLTHAHNQEVSISAQLLEVAKEVFPSSEEKL